MFRFIVLAVTLAAASAAPGYLGGSPYLAGPAVLPGAVGYAAAPALVKGYGSPLAYGHLGAAPLAYASPAIVKSPLVAPAPLAVASPALYKSPVLAAPYGLHGAPLGYASPYGAHYLH